MKLPIPENLTALARRCAFPLYLVGGSVRDFLAGFAPNGNTDWDICAPATETEFVAAAEACGFTVKSVYRNTGTVKLCDRDGADYEFTRFRSDKYVRGLHAPSEIEFTSDMEKDARRRDFLGFVLGNHLVALNHNFFGKRIYNVFRSESAV